MKIFLKELFEYNNHFNQMALNVLIENPNHISDQILKIFCHIENSHHIWNNKIQTTPTVIPRKPWGIYSITELIEIEKENFNSTISLLEKFDLDFQIRYTLSSGKIFTNSVRDILFQIINHSTYHRGQLATEFRKSDIEPLMTDWISYKMK